MRRTFFLSVALVVVLLTGCGRNQEPSLRADDGPVRFTTTAMILEAPGRSPELCLGAVAESYPPQCGGPEVIGWDWDTVVGEESSSGTTWGEYTVVGTWDGESFTLTDPPVPPDPTPRDGGNGGDPDRFSTPCAPPEGGWQVVDMSMATDEALNAATAYASGQPELGGVWIDQSINPAAQGGPVDDLASERAMNDPTKLILNVSFSERVDEHETAIRELWGGPLCVSVASISASALEAIRAEITEEHDDLLYSSVDGVRGHVSIGVIVDGGMQARLDDRYGEGVVRVDARLRPVAE